MITEDLHIKTLPEELLIRYFSGITNEEEKYLVEELKDKYENPERFKLIKELFESGELNRGMLPAFESSDDKENPKEEPKAGQIWSLKRIPEGLTSPVEPFAHERMVYMLTNPEPYINDPDDEICELYPEYYSIIALPVSLNVEYATHRDYLVESGNDLLGLEFMIETDLEFNIARCNLSRLIGRMDKNRINELLNVYFAASKMEYDKEVFAKALKGNFFEKDYGDIYEFKQIEEENITMLSKPIEQIPQFFKVSDLSESIDEVNYLRADFSICHSSFSSSDLLFADNKKGYSVGAYNILDEKRIFSDSRLTVSLIVTDNHNQKYIKVVSRFNEKLNAELILSDKRKRTVLKFYDVNLKKPSDTYLWDIDPQDKVIEIKMVLKGKVYFLQNFKF